MPAKDKFAPSAQMRLFREFLLPFRPRNQQYPFLSVDPFVSASRFLGIQARVVAISAGQRWVRERVRGSGVVGPGARNDQYRGPRRSPSRRATRSQGPSTSLASREPPFRSTPPAPPSPRRRRATSDRKSVV